MVAFVVGLKGACRMACSRCLESLFGQACYRARFTHSPLKWENDCSGSSSNANGGNSAKSLTFGRVDETTGSPAALWTNDPTRYEALDVEYPAVGLSSLSPSISASFKAIIAVSSNSSAISRYRAVGFHAFSRLEHGACNSKYIFDLRNSTTGTRQMSVGAVSSSPFIKNTQDSGTPAFQRLAADVERIGTILGEHDWTPQKKMALEMTGIQLRPSHVIKIVERQTDLSLAISFFEWAAQQPGCQHNSSTYNALLGVLGRAKMFDDMEKILQQMKRQGITKTRLVLATLATSYGMAGMACEALASLNEMKFLGSRPNVSSYNNLMNVLVKAGFYDKAYSVYGQMQMEGCLPDAHTFGILINSFGSAGKLDLACSVLEEMKMKAFQPNVVVYSSLLKGLCKARKVEKAISLFSDMKAQGCSPNIITYNTLLDGLGKAGKIKEAIKLFDEMVEMGCVDVVSYNTHLLMLGKFGLLEGTFNVLNLIREKRFSPEVRTYNILIDNLSKAGKVHEVCKVFEEMKASGVKPNVLTYTLVIKSMLIGGMVIESTKVLHDMQGQGFVPDSGIYNTLITILCESQDLQGARELVHDMLNSGHKPTLQTCNLLLNGFCKADRRDEALELFEQMRNLGCLPNSELLG